MLKQLVSAMNMMPLAEGVTIPFLAKFIDDQNMFAPDEIIIKSAQIMLTELGKWGENLKLMRK